MLIRHGATQWSVSGRHTGRTDIALTSKGREQAQVTAVGIRSLLGNEFDFVRVFTSPLQRATETASIVIGPGIPVTRDENLLEFNYGEYEGLTLEEIQTRRPGWNLWIDGCPGGETAHQVGERADTFLTSLSSDDGPIVVFSHGHLLRVLAARYIGLDAKVAQFLMLDTATISVLQDLRGSRVINVWNLDSALLFR